jgi:hypothetical protein
MFSTAEKTVRPAALQRQQNAGTHSFFRKAGEESFFGSTENKSFFHASVQPKLQVSHPDDPQEKEADAVADQVMRMEDSAGAHTVAKTNAETVHRSKEETGQENDQQEDKDVHRSAITPGNVQIIQRQAISEKKDNEVQAKSCNMISRQAGAGGFITPNNPESENGTAVQAKLSCTHHSLARVMNDRTPLQQSVSGTTSFEHSLSSTKGGGSVLPDDTRQFMESRFGADFSNVRIHTGSQAESLSRSINAHAFAHGSDIYFNSGKYSPGTVAGGYLLAHELTHTIQQGASPRISRSVAGRSIQKKDSKQSIQRNAGVIKPANIAQENVAGNNNTERIEGASHDVSTGTIQAKVETSTRAPVIQRSWLGNAGRWMARGIGEARQWLLTQVRDVARRMPGYSLVSLALGHDPITGEERPLTGSNLLHAILDVVLGGAMFRALLNSLGIFNHAATWLMARLTGLRALVSGIGQRFSEFWRGISLRDVAHPGGVIDRAMSLISRTVMDGVGFARQTASTFLTMISRVMIRQISAFVRRRIPRLFPLLTVALGFNPETLERVERNGTNILNAFLEVSEAGRQQRAKMQETHTFERIAGWIDRGISVFGRAYALLRQAISGIWDYVTIENLFHPMDTLSRIWNQFSEPVALVGNFLNETAREILRVIKDALLSRLSNYARQTRGFSLICVIIGRDPFTGQAVPRTVHNIVRGFMGLMEGGEQQYEQLRQSGAIDRIVGRINAAVGRLNMTLDTIVQLFRDVWRSFTIHDIFHPINAFVRVVATFGAPILRLIHFAIEILMIVVEAVLMAMNFPFDLIRNIISRARQAFHMIRRDPVAFFRNMLRAVKQGFIQFFNRIGTHLRNGLTGWLMSELRDAGVAAPANFTLRGVITWVLQVLNITMEKIWEKLAAHPRVGPERVARIRRVINTLEGVWTFIRDVQQRGMAAIWERIQERLTNLWNTIQNAIQSWLMDRVINRITTRLLSLLDPTGIMAIVNSAIALYRAIQSFIRYLRQMLQVVNSFVEGLVEIAGGNIARAANTVESSLARTVPIVIGFLANQLGLSGIGRQIGEMIGVAREMVDRALTWLVNRTVDTGLRLLDRVMAVGRSARDAVLGWLGLRKRFTVREGEEHTLYFSPSKRLMMASTPVVLGNFVQNVRIPAIPHKQVRLNDLKNSITNSLGEIDILLSAPSPNTSVIENKLLLISPRIAELIRETTGLLFQSEEPQYGDKYGGHGSGMRVRIVNGTPATIGSDVSIGDNHWPSLTKRRTSMGSVDRFYVRAHLLNRRLGGPGNDWKNLSILTQHANNRGNEAHENLVESRLTNTPLMQSGAYVYVVTATYGRSKNQLLINTINDLIAHKNNPANPSPTLSSNISNLSAFTIAQLTDVVSIIEAEQFVPTSFVCTISVINPHTGRTINSPYNINASIRNNIDLPYFV